MDPVKKPASSARSARQTGKDRPGGLAPRISLHFVRCSSALYCQLSRVEGAETLHSIGRGGGSHRSNKNEDQARDGYPSRSHYRRFVPVARRTEGGTGRWSDRADAPDRRLSRKSRRADLREPRSIRAPDEVTSSAPAPGACSLLPSTDAWTCRYRAISHRSLQPSWAKVPLDQPSTPAPRSGAGPSRQCF